MNTLLGTNTYPFPTHFFLSMIFPSSFGGICDRFLEGNYVFNDMFLILLSFKLCRICRNVVYHLRNSHVLQSCTLFSDPYMIRHVYNYIIYILLVKKHFENDPTQLAGLYVIGKYCGCVGF